jgi:hypothetical protein
MSTVNGGPGNIVTNGLVLNLDAANPRSYPQPYNGTTWINLAGTNNGTLTNGPTYNSANGGSIIFDGVDDYVDCGNPISLQINTGTICVWVKTASPGSGFRGIITKQNNYGLFTNSSVLVTYDWGNAAIRSTGINIADGQWRNICMSFTDNTGTPSNNAIIYVNSIPVLTTTIKFTANTLNLELARGGSSSPEQILNGSIAQTLIYNRSLSSTEILQNFNATRARFGV